MLKWLKAQLKEKEQKRDALKIKVDKAEERELDGLDGQLRAINEDIENYRNMIIQELEKDDPEEQRGDEFEDQEQRGDEFEDQEQRNQPNGKPKILGAYGLNNGQGDKRDEKDNENWEERGAHLLEKRAVTVSSGDLVLPKHTSSQIKGTFNQVSTLVDRVNIVPLDGGESYETAYDVSHGEGNYTAEGDPYFDVNQEFGYAKIQKTKITAYNEVTEEALKLPKAAYGQKAIDGVRKALRKKMAKEILNGGGPTADEFVGIFSSEALAINPVTDMEIGEINEDTLDDIIYGYGGDEDVEDEAVLIISKDDLRQFAKVRLSDGTKAYQVENNGNTGRIDGVQYLINSGAGTLATAADGDYLMAYGPLSNYEMAIFSGTDVKRSDDVKFKEGMIAHRGGVMAGGNVAAFNGFLRVKKAPTV